jgi:hypothetical protein
MMFGRRCFINRNGIVTRCALAMCGLFVAAVISGCGALQQTPQSQTQAQAQPRQPGQMFIDPKVVDVPPHPLPFKGRLVEGDPSDVPPAVAMSLSSSSTVTFTYREELTHDDYHVPLAASMVDPGAWIGDPVGDFGVTAFASLSISDGDRVLGDYTAKEHVSQSYSFYAQPTHKELEDAARVAVRQRIDQKLYSDETRLAELAASSGKPATAHAGR